MFKNDKLTGFLACESCCHTLNNLRRLYLESQWLLPIFTYAYSIYSILRHIQLMKYDVVYLTNLARRYVIYLITIPDVARIIADYHIAVCLQ